MAKKQRDEGGGDEWLNTYADMVTLLLTFFAVLLSMSTVDEVKLNAFIRSFANLPQEVVEDLLSGEISENPDGTEMIVNTNMEDLYDSLKKYIKENNKEDMVEVFKIDDILYIRFTSALFFQPDRYVLLDNSLPVLSFVGEALNSYKDQIRMVNVLGFTATVENGTYWMLSGERAAAVATFINETSAFDPEKLTVIGYGNRYPVATNDTEEGRRQNRRVELVVVGNESAEDFNITEAMGDFYNGDVYPTDGNPENAFKPVDGEALPLPPATGEEEPGAEETNTTPPEGAIPEGGDVEMDVSPYDE